MLPEARFVCVILATVRTRVSLDVVVHVEVIVKEFRDGETSSADRAPVAVLVQVNTVCVPDQPALRGERSEAYFTTVNPVQSCLSGAFIRSLKTHRY